MSEKIAILHDYFDEIGGAEITLLYMSKILDAPIFTTNINKKKISDTGFDDVLPRIYSIGKVPKTKHIKQFMTQNKFSRLKLEGFDKYIFTGFYSIHAAKNHKPNIWYCFTPLKGLYDSEFRVKKWKLLFKNLQKKQDKKAVSNIDKIISNSENVKKRVRKVYSRESKIIHHPTDISKFYYRKPKNYWLSVSRINPLKRIGLQINAFKKIPKEKLVIIGSVSEEYKNYLKRLKNNSPENVEFIGSVFDRKRLAELYANSKGLICTAKDEDFGMTPVESMASGKPVIASNEGGYKETVVDGKTGKLIDDINPEKLSQEIEKVSKELKKNPSKYKKDCQKQAEKFGLKEFEKKVKMYIKNNEPKNKEGKNDNSG